MQTSHGVVALTTVLRQRSQPTQRLEVDDAPMPSNTGGPGDCCLDRHAVFPFVLASRRANSAGGEPSGRMCTSAPARDPPQRGSIA